MTMTHSRRGRFALACDWPGCRARFHVRGPGESLIELRLRATVNGWKRFARMEICPRHTAKVQAALEGRAS